jgi:ferrochelatase
MKTGVLLVNLGTPASPTPAAVRQYLNEFLSDPRVVELPRLLWLPLLRWVITPLRSKRVAKMYQNIWQKESPLLQNTRAQAQALQALLASSHEVRFAMNYGEPSIAKTLDELLQQNIERLIILPLYPQYSATSTAAVFDAVTRYFASKRYIPEIQFLSHYENHPAYIQAIAASIREHWQQAGKSPLLLFSFHGLPARNIVLGDPYQQQCIKTATAVAQQLQLANNEWQVVFQSRFGRAKWLEPYTDVTLKKLASLGVERVDIICPGFASDCLETLEEVQVLFRKIFLEAGGKIFHYIPALNTRADHIQMMANLIGTA